MTRHSLLIQKKAFKGSWTSFWMLLLTKDWRSTARRPFAWWSRRKGSRQRATLYAMEQVNSFNYLGSMLTSDGRCEKEIRRRIGMAKTSFNQMSPVLIKDRKLSIPLKVRLLKCFIWSVLLYGCESWTLSAALTRNIEATEMWFYRRMLRVSYTAHETNISVLQRMGQERQLLRTIKERQTSFTGHIIRKGELEDLILAGKVQGKKARGGQRLLFLNQVMENTGLTSLRTIWDAARNRTLEIKIS